MLHRFASDEILCSAEDDDSLSWVVLDPSKVAIKSMAILDRSAPVP